MTKLGATGDHPQGKLNADDEGGLVIGCAADHSTRTVRVDFGKHVAWVAMPPERRCCTSQTQGDTPPVEGRVKP